MSHAMNCMNPELEKIKCQSCANEDIEENLNFCKTCDNSKLGKHVDAPLKLALCTCCAIDKHLRLGHITVDFFPNVRDFVHKTLAPEVKTAMKEKVLETKKRKAEEEKLREMNESIRKKLDELLESIRNSTSTTQIINGSAKISLIAEKAAKINKDVADDLRNKTKKMEKLLGEFSND